MIIDRPIADIAIHLSPQSLRYKQMPQKMAASPTHNANKINNKGGQGLAFPLSFIFLGAGGSSSVFCLNKEKF